MQPKMFYVQRVRANFYGTSAPGGACTYDRSVTSCTTRRAGRTLHGTRSVRGARTPKCDWNGLSHWKAPLFCVQ